MADENKTKKQSGLGNYIFVGCLIIGLGIGIGYNLMPTALLVGLGVGFITMGISRYKKW